MWWAALWGHPVNAADVGLPVRVLLFRVPSGRRALSPRGHCACPALLASLRVLVLRFGALRVLALFLSPSPRGLAGAFLLHPAALCGLRLCVLLPSLQLGFDFCALRALWGPLRAHLALNYVKLRSGWNPWKTDTAPSYFPA